MKDFVQKAREFARGPYAEALQQGDQLPPAEFDAIAAKVASLHRPQRAVRQGVQAPHLATRFRKELLRDDEQILGRYDARFEGYDIDNAGENPGYDPSDTGISGVFVGAFHDYLASELKYTSSEPYYLHGPGINQNWDWHHRPSGGGFGGGGGRAGADQPDTVIDLADAMRKNPQLKVFSANGWFDLATPFFGTEHDLAQMMLPAVDLEERAVRLLSRRPHGLPQRRRPQGNARRPREVVPRKVAIRTTADTDRD